MKNELRPCQFCGSNGCPLYNDAEIECILNKEYPQDWPLHL